MQKIITLLFVITLINAASGAVVEFTAASAKTWKDDATASLSVQNIAKGKANGLTVASQILQTAGAGKMKSSMELYGTAVAAVGPANQAMLLTAATAGSDLQKTAVLLAATAIAKAANDLSIADVIAYNKRSTDMALATVSKEAMASQLKAVENTVDVVTNLGLVGQTATFQKAFVKYKKYLDTQVSGVDTSTTLQAFTDAQDGVVTATSALTKKSSGTGCIVSQQEALEAANLKLYTASVAQTSQVNLKTQLEYLQEEWAKLMGTDGIEAMTTAETNVGAVKKALTAYKVDVAAQSKVITDQQAVVAGLITDQAKKVSPLSVAYNKAKGLSDTAGDVSAASKILAKKALAAWKLAVGTVVSTRTTRDADTKAAMILNNNINVLAVAEATVVGAFNYETSNLALADVVVAEVAARATMRADLVAAAKVAATNAKNAADKAVTDAAAATAAAIKQANIQLGIDTTAGVNVAKLATQKTDMVKMVMWNESYALDALIAKKICDAAVAEAGKPKK